MNRFNPLFYLILFFSTAAHAQSKWWVGGTGNYSSYKNTGPKNPVYMRGETDAIQYHANQWTVGLCAERKITKNLFVQSGLQWSYFSLVARTWDQSSSGAPDFFVMTTNNAQEVVYEATNRFYNSRNYITVPALVRFSVYQATHFGLYLKGGVNALFAVSDSKASVERGDIAIQDNLKSNYFSNKNDIYVEGNTLVGVSFGNPKTFMSHLEGGLTVPITAHAGTNKLGVGYKLSYIFLIHL